MTSTLRTLLLFAGLINFTLLKSQSLIPFHAGKQWGYSDSSGKLIIPATYDSAAFFRSHTAQVWKNGLTGFINDSNRVVRPLVYQWIKNAGDAVMIKKDNQYGFVRSKDFSTILPLQYDTIYYLTDKYWAVKKGSTLKVFKYQPWAKDSAIEQFSGSYDSIRFYPACFCYKTFKDNNADFFTSTFKSMPPPKNAYWKTSPGEKIIEISDVNGYSDHWLFDAAYEIDQNGRKAIVVRHARQLPNEQPVFRNDTFPSRGEKFNMSRAGENIIGVKSKGYWGTIDTLGRVQVKAIYDTLLFDVPLTGKNGQLLAGSLHKEYGVVDLTNKTIVPFEYDSLQQTNDFGGLLLYKGNLFGLFFTAKNKSCLTKTDFRQLRCNEMIARLDYFYGVDDTNGRFYYINRSGRRYESH